MENSQHTDFKELTYLKEDFQIQRAPNFSLFPLLPVSSSIEKSSTERPHSNGPLDFLHRSSCPVLSCDGPFIDARHQSFTSHEEDLISLFLSLSLPGRELDSQKDVGIPAMDIYFPPTCVQQEALEDHDGASKGKYTIGRGQDCMPFVRSWKMSFL